MTSERLGGQNYLRQLHRQRAVNSGGATGERQNASEQLAKILNLARAAVPANIHPDRTGEGYISSKGLSSVPGLTDVLSFGADLTEMFDDFGALRVEPYARDAGREIKLSEAIAQNSRTVAAGANVIMNLGETAEVNIGDETVIGSISTTFTTFEPVEFSKVDFVPNPDSEVTLSPLPFHDAQIDPTATTSRAVAFRLPRKVMKSRAPDVLASELLFPIVNGIGRAIDATIFAALEQHSLSPWGIGRAAQLGVPIDAVRAVVGTSAAGAAMHEGKLYAHGVSAETTPDTARTFLGVWNRCAIVIDPKINVVASRANLRGDLQLACWVSLQALVPNPEAFWEII